MTLRGALESLISDTNGGVWVRWASLMLDLIVAEEAA